MERPTELIESLRSTLWSAPDKLHFWPTHFAGTVPYILTDEDGTLFTADIRNEGRWIRPTDAERAIRYAKRMTIAANAIPTLLAYIGELEDSLIRVTEQLGHMAIEHAEERRKGVL